MNLPNNSICTLSYDEGQFDEEQKMPFFTIYGNTGFNHKVIGKMCIQVNSRAVFK